MTKKTTVLVANSRMMTARIRSSWVICGNISSGSLRAAAATTLLYMNWKPCQSGYPVTTNTLIGKLDGTTLPRKLNIIISMPMLMRGVMIDIR